VWWIADPARLKREVAAIDEVRERESWLTTATPLMGKNLTLTFSFEIALGSEAVSFTLEYPAFFPDVPPSVRPCDPVRLSSHQYGAGGEMCLEYRSDNWDPSITGAMMIESTHRLLAGERPGPGLRAAVPSAHAASLGQQLRGLKFRFLVTDNLLAHIAQMMPGSCHAATVSDLVYGDGIWTAHVLSIGVSDNPDWTEDQIPLRRGTREPGFVIRVSSVSDLPAVTDQPSLTVVASQAYPQGICTEETPPFVIFSDGQDLRAYYSFRHKGQCTVFDYRPVPVGNSDPRRLPGAFSGLGDKKVGIVGCGSLGSKIATMLARSGVGHFVLVDDDILTLSNLVRHELDADCLGVHKVDALKHRLRSVTPDVKISARRVGLGKQESSGSTASVIDELSTCDLIIDATADSQAFNYVAAVSQRFMRPMIWAEVYAGGIGGFVACIRPQIDPPPLVARRQYMAWCRERAVPWTSEDHNYGTSVGEAEPWVADDADVTVIAAHAGRMGLDTLVRLNGSKFPYPAYAIGLTSGWIFEGPHDTHPVNFAATEEWRSAFTPDRTEDAIAFMSSLLNIPSDEDSSGP
jgi:molybdopterin/thiamine biosynthesis adenylyltransferase/ubiquitin-protein ligase